MTLLAVAQEPIIGIVLRLIGIIVITFLPLFIATKRENENRAQVVKYQIIVAALVVFAVIAAAIALLAKTEIVLSVGFIVLGIFFLVGGFLWLYTTYCAIKDVEMNLLRKFGI